MHSGIVIPIEPIPAKRRRKSSEPSGDESSKTADTTKTPVKTAEPKPTTSKDTTESSETPTDIPTKATQKTPEPNSEGEEKPSDAKPEPAKYQGRRSGVPKEKPTLLDQVVKNLETIFKMMKKWTGCNILWWKMIEWTFLHMLHSMVNNVWFKICDVYLCRMSVNNDWTWICDWRILVDGCIEIYMDIYCWLMEYFSSTYFYDVINMGPCFRTWP